MAYSASLGASALMRSEAQPLRYSCCVFRILSKYIVKTQGGGQRLSGPLAPLHRNGGFLGAPPPSPPSPRGNPRPLMGFITGGHLFAAFLLPMPFSGLYNADSPCWLDPLSCALIGLPYILHCSFCNCCMFATVNIAILTSSIRSDTLAYVAFPMYFL